MSFIQTAQNVDLSNTNVTHVAGNQYNINVYNELQALNPALNEPANRIQDTERLHSATSSSQEMNARFEAKDGQPPRALFAAFDSNNDRTRCLKGTRTDILDQVFRWLSIRSTHNGESDAPRDPQGTSCIFWINGSAGTGKTTISYTVAEECRKRGILGASFFCSRDDSACSDPGLIFTTIAHQLGIFNPLFKTEVLRVMTSQPDIGYASIPYQIEQLIVNPLRSLACSIRPCVVVVDALDECRDNGTPSTILSSLARYVSELSPLKFLITSRPENHITTAFRDKEMTAASRRLILHEVHLEVVQDDMTSYLLSKLSLTRDAYDIQCEWPAMEDVRELARLSHGLFIFAATSVKFIEDRNYCDPRGQLADLLNAPPESDDASPHVHLYRLYTQVLNRAFPNISSRLSERIKTILGSVVLIREPLSPFALENLIGLGRSTVRETLVHLHSIIIVPEEDTRAIRSLHPSFFDFITNPLRCQNPKFVVNAETQHTFLARACFRAMGSLQRNICGITNPSILNSEMDDLSARIKTSILPHVQYACRHWASHLVQATFSDDLVNLLEEFCAKKRLNWLEVCSLLGQVRNALLALNTTQQAVLTSGWDMPGALQLLRDCERFTLEFFPVISACAPQVYLSALLFTPKKTAMREVYGEFLDQSIEIYNAPDETWTPCMRVMEGHTGHIDSVAFSPDGARIVSGSYDSTLRLWDAVSGAHLTTLGTHSGTVKSVAFSPDGTRIISGSDDTTLRLWDAVSGAHLVTLSGHSSEVRSVAFSPDGTRIVSASHDKTLRLWDAISGAHLVTLSGHSTFVRSVAFSPDGTRIVSGSWDSTLRLWDAASGAHLITLTGPSGWVNSVAFSPDGTRIVSGSGDNDLRLWDATSGAHLVTLRGHLSWINSVAFSPDGTRIASGSSDRTLQLWDAISGAHLVTLSGHSSAVHSVAFSPDATHIVSGSYDNTLRLWDAVSGAHLVTLSRHSSFVISVAFSPDATHIVSGSEDNTLMLWNAVNGAHLVTMSGHSGFITSVAFSPDGTRIVSASWDETLRLWDAVSGAHIVTLSGHSGLVSSVVFSPDGTRLVSGSHDKTLRFWDVVSGAHLITLSGHSGSVNSVAFSPDGTRVASGSSDKTLQLWDAVSGAHLVTLSGHSSEVYFIAFSPDGTRIVSGSDDNTLRLWDALSGVQLVTLSCHPESVSPVAFSPDGAHIVSGSWDKTLRLWDAPSGVPLRTIQSHSLYVSSLARSLSSSCTSFSERDAVLSAPTCIFSYMTEDGWIYSMTLNRRICWVPLAFRPRAVDVTRDSVVFGTHDGGVVILRFNNTDNLF